MWTWILGIGGKALSLVTGLLGVLKDYAVIGVAYFLGRRSEQKRQAEKASEIKDKQLEIAAEPDLHRRDLLDRMFKRKRQ